MADKEKAPKTFKILRAWYGLTAYGFNGLLSQSPQYVWRKFDKCKLLVYMPWVFYKRQYQSHPYTDVYALKQKFDFSCINFAIGYYNYHTANEYVIVEDVYNGIETGKEMIEKLGNVKYPFIPPESRQYRLFM